LETAATNSGFEIQLIPGSKIGYRHRSRVVMRVRIGAARCIMASSGVLPSNEIHKINKKTESYLKALEVRFFTGNNR
jgi:hypothetical protein